MGALKRLKRPALAVLRALGRLAVAAPTAPRATGGYGLACRGGLILLFLIGLGLSWPWPPVGLAVMIAGALALLQFFLLQYRGVLHRRAVVAWLLVAAAVLVAVVTIVWSRWDGGGGTGGDAMVLVAVVAGSAVVAGVRLLFREIFGPHHPESPLPEPLDPLPLWFWIGGVADDRATIVARLAPWVDADSIVLECCAGPDPAGNGPRSLTGSVDERRFARFELTGLCPDRRHGLRLQARRGDRPADGLADTTVEGSFTTFPPEGRQATVTLAFGSCMSTGSRGRVFDTIAGLEPRPRIFFVTGDLHYENINANRLDSFLDTYDLVHASHPQRRLYTTTPMGYMWDDHDYGDNDSHAGARSKHAAQLAYRMAVPSYVDGGPDGPGVGAIHQAFTIGRVRVVITDARSERSEQPGHLLNPETERWLVDQIGDPAWPLVIWVSPTPWISDAADSDNWGAYPDQRRRIATAIGHRTANLVMVSGDAHMVAIDDGTNSGYAGDGSGFPVLHAAALDRRGSVKGGRFSHGKFPGGGQFGLVTVDDRGDEITVDLAGHNWTGARIVGHSLTVPGSPAASSPPTGFER